MLSLRTENLKKNLQLLGDLEFLLSLYYFQYNEGSAQKVSS